MEMCLRLQVKNDKYVVDRIEDGVIVLENLTDKSIIEIEDASGVMEGDIVQVKDGELMSLKSETDVRKRDLRSKLNNLKRK